MCVLLITRLLRGVGRWARKPVNHTSWVAVVTPTDRPKSVRNCCLIELFCGVVCVVTLSLWHFCWYRGFCHRTGSDLLLFVWVVIFHLRQPMGFLSLNLYDTPGLAIRMNVLYLGPGDFPVSYSNRDTGTLEIVFQEVLWSIWGSYSAIWSIPLTNVKWHSDPWPTVTSQPIRLFTNFMTLIPSLTFTDYEWFPWSICNGFGMPAGNAYPSGHLVPSPILGLANAPIVETKFLELAMSLLDFSPRIPLGTFSILLGVNQLNVTTLTFI